VRLRKNRGTLLTRKNGVIDIIARGRLDWGGWVELKLEAVNELSSQHIAEVMEEVKADIIGVVEVENRPALLEFNTVIEAVNAPPYDDVMVIDGNDDRGIDVGIMARSPWTIGEIRSHVGDEDEDGVVFSRDCPEYMLATADGKRIVVLMNHLKSKGYATPDGETPDHKRERQAKRVATIYRRLRNAGEKYIAILGDFNDFKKSYPLKPLFTNTGLKDISEHPSFDSGGYDVTYGRQGEKEKFDYILLSPDLFSRVTGGTVCRLGVWGKNKSPPKWKIFDTLTRPEDAASDHAAIYADINL
jgi:endonuclease/exonuclease/phosphatase family metal-dependent hydrolase